MPQVTYIGWDTMAWDEFDWDGDVLSDGFTESTPASSTWTEQPVPTTTWS